MAIAYGKRSRAAIAELDGRLQRLLHRYADAVGADLDLTVTEGHRGEAAQNAAFEAGFSKKRWPDSGHNSLPARAFDFECYPRRAADAATREGLLLRQGALRAVAYAEKIPLKPLISWDLYHVELAE